MDHTDTVELDGRRFAWRTVGAGPPLVLLNGYSGTAADWDPTLLGALAGAFTVVCPDHRGMGASDLGAAADVTIDAMAGDVQQLMDALGIVRAPVAGWSMGGFVAQRLAVRAPATVDALVLMATDAGGPAAVRATPEVWARLTDHSGTPRQQASRLIPLLFPPPLVDAIDAAFGDLIAEARAALSLEAVVAQQRAMEAWHAKVQPRPEAGAAPRALVMVGEADVVIPPANAELLAEVWPDSEIDRFASGGHAFFAVEPTRAADRIRSFLDA